MRNILVKEQIPFFYLDINWIVVLINPNSNINLIVKESSTTYSNF